MVAFNFIPKADVAGTIQQSFDHMVQEDELVESRGEQAVPLPPSLRFIQGYALPELS